MKMMMMKSFIIINYFTRIAASSTVIDDVTKIRSCIEYLILTRSIYCFFCDCISRIDSAKLTGFNAILLEAARFFGTTLYNGCTTDNDTHLGTLFVPRDDVFDISAVRVVNVALHHSTSAEAPSLSNGTSCSPIPRHGVAAD